MPCLVSSRHVFVGLSQFVVEKADEGRGGGGGGRGVKRGRGAISWKWRL